MLGHAQAMLCMYLGKVTSRFARLGELDAILDKRLHQHRIAEKGFASEFHEGLARTPVSKKKKRWRYQKSKQQWKRGEAVEITSPLDTRAPGTSFVWFRLPTAHRSSLEITTHQRQILRTEQFFDVTSFRVPGIQSGHLYQH